MKQFLLQGKQKYTYSASLSNFPETNYNEITLLNAV